jgi:predicted amino acid racemase
MGYPRIEIDLRKFQENVEAEVKFMRERGIEVMAVNKVFNGDAETAAAAMRGGINVIAESRVENLKKIKNVPCQKALIRSPAPSEIEETVKYADISLNSEPGVLQMLSREAVKQGRTHQVLLMVDMGDIREGVWYENIDELTELAGLALDLDGIDIYGLGTNFNCYGAALPTVENNERFVGIAEEVERKLGTRFKFLSGGNCTSCGLAERGLLPKRINHLRIGGYHQFGQNYVDAGYRDIFHHSRKDPLLYLSDLYIYKAELIEVNRKPTVPVGELGKDAFLQTKSFTDKGVRLRGLLAFGRRDVPYENIRPVDDRLEILGQTSDHTVIDMENCCDYRVGDVISFEVDYTALLNICSSDTERRYSYK